MSRKIIVFLCISLFSFLFPLTVGAHETGILRVVINGHLTAAVAEPVIIGEMPFVPLRAVSEKLGGELSWDAARKLAMLDYSGKQYIISGIIKNGRLMVPYMQIAQLYNLQSKYEPMLSAVVFGHGPLPYGEQLSAIFPRYEFYSPDDVYWLSRIVEAEARGENYLSRLAVASVVLNRQADPGYPDTIKEVIFDKKHGVQFTPTVNGAINREPSALSMLAALDALEGQNNAPGALFFLSPKLATNFWIQKNRQFAFTIGGHAYYY